MSLQIKKHQEFGILCLIDIVDFTDQSNALGARYTSEFLDYYYEASRNVVKQHSFQWVKSIGDAVLFFGDINNPEGLVQIMLDLFKRKKIKDRYGFKALFRLVAHCGFFQFWLDEKGNKIDLTGSEAIKLFRLEKKANREELVVSEALFRGLQAHLVKHGIKYFKESSPELLKGFEREPVFIYRLFIGKEGEASADLRYA